MSVRMESQKRVTDLRREDATLATSLSEERHGEQVLSGLTFKTIKTEVATLAASLSEERHGEQVLSRLTFKTIKREVATLAASLSEERHEEQVLSRLTFKTIKRESCNTSCEPVRGETRRASAQPTHIQNN